MYSKNETIARSYQMGWTIQELEGYYRIPADKIRKILLGQTNNHNLWKHMIPIGEAIA